MCSKPQWWQLAAAVAVCILAVTGCSPYRNSVPASCVRPSYFDNPRGNKHPINYIKLRQDPPAVYMLGPRDILGVFIEGVLGRPDDSPPVHFPEQQSSLPPSIGYPMPVREDGTLSLPLIPPINVSGLSLAQVEHEIRKAYTVDRQILQPDRARIIVTLMKPRSYAILVVREDSSTLGSGNNAIAGVMGYAEPGRRGQAREVNLKAYENDVLHALVETGGMPGLDAKNEIYIIRGGFKGTAIGDMQRSLADPAARAQLLASNTNLTRIPLRLGPNDPTPTFTPDDVVLNSGDVVFLESRGSEVYYTGGLLQGRQIPIPRDYDLDVLGAVAMAGGSVASSAGGNPMRNTGGGVGNLFPPTRVVLVRNVGDQLVTIKVNLRTALTSPQERILVQPNDYVILEYTETELLINILLNNLSLNFSLNQLFNR